jgi:hypothetical protein
MVRKCLMTLLTADGKKNDNIWLVHNYRIGGGDKTTCLGVALLKIII